MSQEREQRQRGHGHDDEESPGPEVSGQQRREKLDEDAEATLDEIDDVLESDAEDFVRSYVQKQGQ